MVDKEAKTLWLESVAPNIEPGKAASDFFATKHVFAHIGWHVKFGAVSEEIAATIKANAPPPTTSNSSGIEPSLN